MDRFDGIYRGKVLLTDVDAADGKFGRIKVEVYPMLLGTETAKTLLKNANGEQLQTIAEGIETDCLPWATPAFPLFEGAGNGYGCFSIPKVGSFVFVFFENGDIYQPVYFAEAADGVHGLPTERLTNYPNRKVMKTEQGITIELDDTDGEEEIKITHPAGATIQIDSSGNITITGTTVNIN